METKKCTVVSNEQLHLQSFRIFPENSEKHCGFISSGTLHQTARMTVQLPAEVQCRKFSSNLKSLALTLTLRATKTAFYIVMTNISCNKPVK